MGEENITLAEAISRNKFSFVYDEEYENYLKESIELAKNIGAWETEVDGAIYLEIPDSGKDKFLKRLQLLNKKYAKSIRRVNERIKSYLN